MLGSLNVIKPVSGLAFVEWVFLKVFNLLKVTFLFETAFPVPTQLQIRTKYGSHNLFATAFGPVMTLSQIDFLA